MALSEGTVQFWDLYHTVLGAVLHSILHAAHSRSAPVFQVSHWLT